MKFSPRKKRRHKKARVWKLLMLCFQQIENGGLTHYCEQGMKETWNVCRWRVRTNDNSLFSSWSIPKLCPISWAIVAAVAAALGVWSCRNWKKVNYSLKRIIRLLQQNSLKLHTAFQIHPNSLFSDGYWDCKLVSIRLQNCSILWREIITLMTTGHCRSS